jgi:hypothetical protein
MPEEGQEEVQEKNPTLDHSMAHSLEMFDSVLWSLVALYICFALQFLVVLVFHVYIHRPLPHERR